MRFNPTIFLQSEFGGSMIECVQAWDKWLHIGDHKAALWCQAQWEVYQMAMRQFYGIDVHFTRTDDYYGIVIGEDEEQWIYKHNRRWKR